MKTAVRRRRGGRFFTRSSSGLTSAKAACSAKYTADASTRIASMKPFEFDVEANDSHAASAQAAVVSMPSRERWLVRVAMLVANPVAFFARRYRMSFGGGGRGGDSSEP